VPIPLVVGVDGSQASLEAVDWAVDEAARHGIPLQLVHGSALTDLATFPRVPDRRVGDDIIASATARARTRAPAMEVSGQVLPENAVDALTGKGRNAFALVVGDRGLGDIAGMLLGSVSLAVAGRADCPVVVVRGEVEHRATRFGNVVVGVEEGGGSDTATEFAYREAQVRGGILLAVHAWRASDIEHPEPAPLPGYLPRPSRRSPGQVVDEALSDLKQRYPQVTVDRRLVEGSPRQALLEAASGADLLVVGARRRHGHFGLQLGLVNHSVLHHAPCPVVIVPQI
jgi:nucleotide-binding universal stress UspA family protein